MMIGPAAPSDIPAIADAYRSLLAYEQTHQRWSNWEAGVYPTIRVPEEKVPRGEMYVLKEGQVLCASMVLNRDQAAEYGAVQWLYPADPERVLVIHTLCVPPDRAGHGYGTAMVRFAQQTAARDGYQVIRLDTYAGNTPARSLYLRNGFRIAGYGHILLQGLISEEQVYLEYRVPPIPDAQTP